MPRQTDPERAAVYQAISVVLLLAAVAGTFVAWLGYGLLCDENCQGRSWELTTQLFVAIGGLVAVVSMTWFSFKRRWTAALWALVASLVLFAAWAVLLDAATHGWGSGPVPL